MKEKRFIGLLILVVAALALAAAGCGGDDDGGGDGGGGGGGATALPSAACGPIRYEGDGEPDAIVASDLPLQGANRALTTEMAEAIEFQLSQRDWKAGELQHRLPVLRRLDRAGGQLGLGEVLVERACVRGQRRA